MQPHERRILGADGQHLLRLADDGLEVAFLVGIVDGDASLLAVQQELHPGEAALQLSDLGDRADGIEHLGGDALDVLPLRHGEDEPVRRRQRGLDGPQGRGPAGADRRGHTGEQHHFPKREHGQSQSFSHSKLLLANPRFTRGKGQTNERSRAALHRPCQA
jgi:hypothetical protein